MGATAQYQAVKYTLSRIVGNAGLIGAAFSLLKSTYSNLTAYDFY